jgi:protein SDA1
LEQKEISSNLFDGLFTSNNDNKISDSLSNNSDKEISDNKLNDKEIAEEEIECKKMIDDEEIECKKMIDEEEIECKKMINEEEISDNELSDEEISDNELSDEEISDNELSDEELSDKELNELQKKITIIQKQLKQRNNNIKQLENKKTKVRDILANELCDINLENKNKIMEKEKDTQNRHKFTIDINVYKKLCQEIKDGKLTEEQISPIFIQTYNIFKIIDIDSPSAYETYLQKINENKKNKNYVNEEFDIFQ